MEKNKLIAMPLAKLPLLPLLLLLLLLAIIPSTVLAADLDYTIALVSSASGVERGQDFTVAVNISSEEETSYDYIQLKVIYDQSKIAYKSASPAEGLLVSREIAGEVLITAQGVNRPTDKAGTLLTGLTFTAGDEGETVLMVAADPLAGKGETVIAYRAACAAPLTVTVVGTLTNEAPQATDVTISGIPEVGNTLTGSYNYTDAEGDTEGSSQYSWFRSDDESGTNEEAIAGATGLHYTLTVADLGKFIRFAVTPAAVTGETQGVAGESARAGEIKPATSAATPVITTQPISETVSAGMSVTLSVLAETVDGGTLTYQWQKNGEDLEGATGASYTINSAADSNAGSYTVVVTNTVPGSAPASIVSDAAVLKIESGQTVDECFIATAAFGTGFSPAVALLRTFRDRVLLTNSTGKAFVRYYYAISPPIAQFIAGSDILKAVVKVLLIPFIAVAYLILNPCLDLAVMIIAVVLTLLYRRKRGYSNP